MFRKPCVSISSGTCVAYSCDRRYSQSTQAGNYQAYPAALPGTILAVILISLLSFCWFKKLSVQ